MRGPCAGPKATGVWAVASRTRHQPNAAGRVLPKIRPTAQETPRKDRWEYQLSRRKSRVTIWAFLVMGISIVVDYSRSRMLSRVAKKYDSQALEADALHFSTDIWSSSVVIGGLTLVVISERLNIPWLAQADAVAAVVVAGIVVWVSLQLGRRTVTALLDDVPASLLNEVSDAVKDVPGVVEIKRVRIRRSGPEAFADVWLTVNRSAAFEHTHDIASHVEEAVRSLLPGADVVVQVEPIQGRSRGAADDRPPVSCPLRAGRTRHPHLRPRYQRPHPGAASGGR